jgi:hypothetical protein
LAAATAPKPLKKTVKGKSALLTYQTQPPPPDTALSLAALDPALNTQDIDLVRATLREVMADPTAPAAARAQAARTMAEMLGALGRHAPPPEDTGSTAPLRELSRQELERELLRHMPGR